ncbi:MAG: HEAT repeat domain-containing protein [Elusimicrobiota bacterium]
MFLPAVVVALTACPPSWAAPVVKSTAAIRAQLGREALAVLSGLAGDADAEVRAAVASSWGELGNRAAMPLLKRALTDANSDVRVAAASSLYRLGDIQGLLALIDETKAPEKTSSPSTPAQALLGMARDAARARATRALGAIAGEAARATLTAAKADPAGEVRDAAMVALARLGDKNAAAPFVLALKDKDEGVRVSAARSLGMIGREGRSELEKLIANDPSASVRVEACAALGGFPEANVVQTLTSALHDKNPRLRSAAVRALAQRRELASTVALKGLMDGAPAPELALTAMSGLAERGEDIDFSLLDLTLGQDDPELKSLAVRSLSATKKPQALQLLAKVMHADPTGKIRAEAAAAVISRLRRIEADK